jgi:RNA polymerase sigma-70 factor (ECF subfamily)
MTERPHAGPVEQLSAADPVLPSDRGVDAELVRRCRGGERSAFDQLVRNYERPVFNVALRMTHSREDALDITQTAFLKAFERLHSYDPSYRFFSWIYRIAVNESLDLLAARRRGVEPVDEQLPDASGRTPESELGELQFSAALQRAIQALRPEHRAVVLLRHVAACSYAEIAQALELPEKTVKSRLFSARQALREALDREGLL